MNDLMEANRSNIDGPESNNLTKLLTRRQEKSALQEKLKNLTIELQRRMHITESERQIRIQVERENAQLKQKLVTLKCKLKQSEKQNAGSETGVTKKSLEGWDASVMNEKIYLDESVGVSLSPSHVSDCLNAEELQVIGSVLWEKINEEEGSREEKRNKLIQALSDYANIRQNPQCKTVNEIISEVVLPFAPKANCLVLARWKFVSLLAVDSISSESYFITISKKNASGSSLPVRGVVQIQLQVSGDSSGPPPAIMFVVVCDSPTAAAAVIGSERDPRSLYGQPLILQLFNLNRKNCLLADIGNQKADILSREDGDPLPKAIVVQATVSVSSD